MKEQTSDTLSVTQEVVIECGNENHHPKKVEERQEDETNNNNHDAGYMTSSNDSLNADVSLNEDDEKWKLSVPPKLSHLSDDSIIKLLRDTRAEIDKIPKEQHRTWLMNRFTNYYSSVMPTSLIELTTSHFFNGDSGISIDIKPEWLDIEKFRRGQKFALDNMFGIFYADLLSLMIAFSFEDGLKPLILTNASSTPYTAFKRYLSTASRVQNWYLSDPWTPGTQAYNDIRTVRRLHAMVRKKIQETPYDEYEKKTVIKQAWCPSLNSTRRDYESTCPAPKPGQCPYTAVGQFPELKEYKLSQGEMSATQFAFVGIAILNPKFFGLHNVTDDDLDAFCHVWRGIGYLLGIEDDFNFCRGTLQDVQKRSRDLLDYWAKPNFRFVTPEWEHMMRCVVEGMQYYFPGSTYETCLLDLGEIMNLHMPRTYQSLSYSTWIRHNFIRFYFNHGSKWSGLRAMMNRQLNSAMEKARNFDDRKHEELREKSAKIVDSYIIKCKRNEISLEQSS